MLAPLAFNLSIMLLLCTLLLLMCWAYDTLGHPVAAEGTRGAESAFPGHPRPRRCQVRPAAASLPPVWRSRPPRSGLWWPPSHVTAHSDLVRPSRQRP